MDEAFSHKHASVPPVVLDPSDEAPTHQQPIPVEVDDDASLTDMSASPSSSNTPATPVLSNTSATPGTSNTSATSGMSSKQIEDLSLTHL